MARFLLILLYLIPAALLLLFFYFNPSTDTDIIQITVPRTDFSVFIIGILGYFPLLLNLTLKTTVKEAIKVNLKHQFEKKLIKFQNFYKHINELEAILFEIEESFSKTRNRIDAETLILNDLKRFKALIQDYLKTLNDIYRTKTTFFKGFIKTERIFNLITEIDKFVQDDLPKIDDLLCDRGRPNSNPNKQSVLSQIKIITTIVEIIQTSIDKREG